MRRVFKSLGRGVAVVSVIAALSMNASAAPRERDRERAHEPVVIKIIKKIIKVLDGDGLTIPKP
jgi:hypothetical protein